MNKEIFSKIVNKYLNGTASKKEAELYESIYDSFQNTQTTWNELQLPPKEKVKNEIFEKIESQLYGSKKKPIKRMFVLRVAASILILLSLSFSGYFMIKQGGLKQQELQLITEVAQYGEKRTIVLEDSTKITLNAGTKISYYKPFPKDKREITLSGEAFFNVTKNKKRPFIVTTNDVKTTVLGTSFNIQAYDDDDINVTVSTGKVKVTYLPPDGSIAKTAILLPGEQAVYSIRKNELSKYKVDIKNFIDWRENILHFNEESFSDIIKKLERNYNVDIDCVDHDLLIKTVTSVYENTDLKEILDDLRFILGIEYSYQSNNKLVITN